MGKNDKKIEEDISKYISLIEITHEKIARRILRENIPAKPNIGRFLNFFKNNNFLNLSSLKDKYKEKWPKLSKILLKYLGQKGGKRLRPLLFLNGYKMFDRKQSVNKKVVETSVGLEILHEAGLIWDDIVDNGSLRRGIPSLWLQIKMDFDCKEKEAKEMASDLGQLCFAWSRYLCVDSQPKKIRSTLKKIFWKAITLTKKGQNFDVLGAKSKSWPTLERALDCCYLKTGPYSIWLPLALSITLAINIAVTMAQKTKQKKILKEIENFAKGFGLAFQLHDDLLILQSDKKIGKNSKTDLINGNKIPLAVLARKLCSKKERIFLDRFWGNKKISQKNMAQIIDIFAKTGALKQIFEKTKEEVRKAKNSLKKIKSSGFDTREIEYLVEKELKSEQTNV